MEIKEIRSMTGLNKKQFSERYNIPYRTIQGWELGERDCPAYVKELLEFKVSADIREQMQQVIEETEKEGCKG
jgi:transcriptional regulator with XRE-family HTH domain